MRATPLITLVRMKGKDHPLKELMSGNGHFSLRFLHIHHLNTPLMNWAVMNPISHLDHHVHPAGLQLVAAHLPQMTLHTGS